MSIEGIKVQIPKISPEGLKALCPSMKDKSDEDLKELLIFVKGLKEEELEQRGESLQSMTYRLFAGALEMKLGDECPTNLAWEEREVAKDILKLMI